MKSKGLAIFVSKVNFHLRCEHTKTLLYQGLSGPTEELIHSLCLCQLFTGIKGLDRFNTAALILLKSSP